MKKVTLLLFIFVAALLIYTSFNNRKDIEVDIAEKNNKSEIESKKEESSNEKIQTPISDIKIPKEKIISNDYQIFQTYNNCGPASLSIALSFFGINKTQKELGEQLRPYQNVQGDNDDKSTTLEELAEKSIELGLIAYHRPAGNIELLKRFISVGLPVIARTRLVINDDVGHYRVVKGFDDNNNEIIQDDSYQGHDIRYKYEDFELLWKTFNYEYLVIAKPNQKLLVEQALGENLNESESWKNALEISMKELDVNSNDIFARFNSSIALYHLNEYEKSINEFELVQNKLPFRALWYQLEPFLAYYKVGNYSKVFELSDKVLNNQNKAYSELYIIRGDSYKAQGKTDLAKIEYEKAVFYNKNLKEAVTKLNSL